MHNYTYTINHSINPKLLMVCPIAFRFAILSLDKNGRLQVPQGNLTCQFTTCQVPVVTTANSLVLCLPQKCFIHNTEKDTAWYLVIKELEGVESAKAWCTITSSVSVTSGFWNDRGTHINTVIEVSIILYLFTRAWLRVFIRRYAD